MPISYIGSAAGTTTATLPAHVAGDVIVCFAFRDGSTTAPTVPAGWTTVTGSSGGANTCASVVAWIKAAAPGTAPGTWTNATGVAFGIWRGVSGIGASATTGASSTSVSYNTLTPTQAGGSSWVVGMAGHRSVDTTLETAPTGMTRRLTFVDATDELAIHDTNSGVTAWATQTVSVAGTASGWRSSTVELVAVALASGSSQESASDTSSGALKVLLNAAGSSQETASDSATGIAKLLINAAGFGAESASDSAIGTVSVSWPWVDAPAYLEPASRIMEVSFPASRRMDEIQIHSRFAGGGYAVGVIGSFTKQPSESLVIPLDMTTLFQGHAVSAWSLTPSATPAGLSFRGPFYSGNKCHFIIDGGLGAYGLTLDIQYTASGQVLSAQDEITLLVEEINGLPV